MSIYKVKKAENEIKKKICLIFLKKINDRRLNDVNITYVKLSNDFANIKIFVIFINCININLKIDLLNKSSNFLRKKLFKKLCFKIVPKIIFLYDYHIEKYRKILNIINNFKK